MPISNTYVVLASGVQARGTCLNPYNNTMLLVDSSNGLVRQYDLSTYSRIEPYCYLSNTTPTGIAMVSSTSAMVCFSGQSSVDLVELSTGHRVTIATPNSTPSQASTVAKGQQIAGDPTNKYALILTTQNLVTLINCNNPTLPRAINTAVSLRSGSTPSTVILKEPGRFLIGSSYGEIYEMDLTGNPVKRMVLSNENSIGTPISVMDPRIVGMSYDNNMLLVTTEVGIIYLIDWSSLTILRTYGANQSNQGILISESASGVCLGVVAPVTSQDKVVMEFDFTVSPLSVGKNPLHLNSGTQIIDVGIHPTTGRGWVIQQTTTTGATTTTTIFFFDVSVRATTTRTVTSANSGQFRLIIVDRYDNSTYLDTLAGLSPATYRVPSGKNIREIVKIGDGATALFSLTYDTT